MDSNKAKKYEKWNNLIAEQEKSSLSRRKFCEERSIKLTTFNYYCVALKTKEKPLTPSNLFNVVKIKKSNNDTSIKVRIVMPNGFQCFVPSHVDPIQIKALVEVLLSC